MSIVLSVSRAPRFALNVPAHVRRVGADQWECGRTINISRSGLLLAVSGSLQCDDPVEAIVQLSDATATVGDVILRGRIARVACAGPITHLATTIDEYRLERPD